RARAGVLGASAQPTACLEIFFARYSGLESGWIACHVEDDRRQVIARRRGYPPRAVLAPLLKGRVAIEVETCPNRPRRMVGEWIVPQELQRRAVALEELDDEGDEPLMAEGRLHGRKPHQPVETQVIWRVLARHAMRVTRLAPELI